MDLEYEKEKLKRLNYETMRLEISKIDIENTYFLDKKRYGYDNARQSYEYSINQADKESYRLGTRFYKLRHRLYVEGILKPYELVKYYDATLIAALHLLRQYGLEYPECTAEEYGKIVYYDDEIVGGLYVDFLSKVINLLSVGKINEFEKNRLFLAGEYLYRRNKYYLHEQRKNISMGNLGNHDYSKFILERKPRGNENE